MSRRMPSRRLSLVLAASFTATGTPSSDALKTLPKLPSPTLVHSLRGFSSASGKAQQGLPLESTSSARAAIPRLQRRAEAFPHPSSARCANTTDRRRKGVWLPAAQEQAAGLWGSHSRYGSLARSLPHALTWHKTHLVPPSCVSTRVCSAAACAQRKRPRGGAAQHCNAALCCGGERAFDGRRHRQRGAGVCGCAWMAVARTAARLGAAQAFCHSSTLVCSLPTAQAAELSNLDRRTGIADLCLLSLVRAVPNGATWLASSPSVCLWADAFLQGSRRGLFRARHGRGENFQLPLTSCARCGPTRSRCFDARRLRFSPGFWRRLLRCMLRYE